MIEVGESPASPGEIVQPKLEKESSIDGPTVLWVQFLDERLQNSPEGLCFEDAIAELNSIGEWAHRRSLSPPLPDTYSEPVYTQFCEESKAVIHTLEQASKYAKPTPDLLALYQQRAQEAEFLEQRKKMRGQLQQAKPTNARVIDITVHDMSALQAMRDPANLPHILHEIRTPFTAMYGTSQLLKRRIDKGNPDAYAQSRDTINVQIPKIKTVLEEQFSRLDETVAYKKEDVRPKDITQAFEDDAKPFLLASEVGSTIDFTVEVSPDIPSNIVGVWSKSWMKGLVCGCVQNCVRKFEGAALRAKEAGEDPDAIPKKAKLSIGLAKNGDFSLTFDDNGKPFDRIFIEKGFIEAQKAGIHGHGHKDVETKGLGMAGHEAALLKYGGTLTAEDIVDENGQQQQGARVRATIPAKLVEPEQPAQ